MGILRDRLDAQRAGRPMPTPRERTAPTPRERIAAARISYNYCGICGSVPRTNRDEPNYAPLRWWDADDGWKIGTLCRYCAEDALDDKPKPTDYAYTTTNGIADTMNTDEDESEALQ